MGRPSSGRPFQAAPGADATSGSSSRTTSSPIGATPTTRSRPRSRRPWRRAWPEIARAHATPPGARPATRSSTPRRSTGRACSSRWPRWRATTSRTWRSTCTTTGRASRSSCDRMSVVPRHAGRRGTACCARVGRPARIRLHPRELGARQLTTRRSLVRPEQRDLAPGSARVLRGFHAALRTQPGAGGPRQRHLLGHRRSAPAPVARQRMAGDRRWRNRRPADGPGPAGPELGRPASVATASRDR